MRILFLVIVMESLWHQTKMPEFPRLKESIKTDVLIIGGGMAGLLCAYFLKQQGMDCILVEENRICSGVTGNTTAKITAQHGEIYQKLYKKLGSERAQLYYKANSEALETYKQLVKGMACDFKTQNSYLYRRNNREKLEKEMAVLEMIGVPAQWIETTDLPFEVVGTICMADQGQFHPLKFAAKDLPIYEHTAVISFDGKVYHTQYGTIDAAQTVVATHFPMWNKNGLYPLKLYQDRSYVLALENAPAIKGMYMDGDPKGLSFRQAGEYLLLGGGAHRTGKKGGGWQDNTAKQYYPNSQVAYRWATQDCMTLDGMPYIGRYSRNTPDLYVATGFQKWGMTGSMVSAKLLTDLLLGKSNPYEALFSPSRSMLTGQLAVNGFEAVTHLLKPTAPRCPHMGCALKWNSREHSWDCPCHGSRFAADGTRLNNPATGDLKSKE